MSRPFRSFAWSACLSAALLTGCHSKPAPGSGAVTVTMPDGSTQVIQPGQPIPAGAVVSQTQAQTSPGMATTAPAPAPESPAAPVVAANPAQEATPVPASAPPEAPPAAAPVPVPALVVPAGTRVTIRTTESLSAEHGGGVGSPFNGVLNSAIVVRGVTAFPRGTPVRGEITSAKGRGRFKGAGILGISLTGIGKYQAASSEFIEREKGRGKRTAGFIGGGGGVGALIGGLAGGGKGALIGGLAGAGGGTAAGAFTGSRDVVIPSESVVSFTLRSSIKK